MFKYIAETMKETHFTRSRTKLKRLKKTVYKMAYFVPLDVLKKALIDYILDTSMNVHNCIEIFETTEKTNLILFIRPLISSRSSRSADYIGKFLENYEENFTFQIPLKNDNLKTLINKIKGFIVLNRFDIIFNFLRYPLGYDLSALFEFLDVSRNTDEKPQTEKAELIATGNDKTEKNNSNLRLIIAALFTWKKKKLLKKDVPEYIFNDIPKKSGFWLPKRAYVFPVSFKFRPREFENSPINLSISKKIDKNIYFDKNNGYIYVTDLKNAYKLHFENGARLISFFNDLSEKIEFYAILSELV